MDMAKRLAKEFNKPINTAASQKDEPGGTLGPLSRSFPSTSLADQGMALGMVSMFQDAGIKYLHVGANDFSTVPALPTVSAGYHGYCNPFVWEECKPRVGCANHLHLHLRSCLAYSAHWQHQPSSSQHVLWLQVQHALNSPRRPLGSNPCYSGPYQFGVETPNMMTVVPGADEALAFLMHVDNFGPQTAQEVRWNSCHTRASTDY